MIHRLEFQTLPHTEVSSFKGKDREKNLGEEVFSDKSLLLTLIMSFLCFFFLCQAGSGLWFHLRLCFWGLGTWSEVFTCLSTNPRGNKQIINEPTSSWIKLIHSYWTLLPAWGWLCEGWGEFAVSSLPLLCCVADLFLLSGVMYGATPVGYKEQRPAFLPAFQGNTGPCFQKL